tara:strand:- start:32246 stop:32614 length:369 start_codon:yes stop_codon:yes gene_type:complete
MTATNNYASSRRIARNKRPAFFDNAETDLLMSMIVALAGEVSVLRDRLDSHERLSAEQGGFGPADVNAYRPDTETMAQRNAARAAYLRRVMRRALDEVAESDGGNEAAAGEALVDMLTQGVK